jgi:hypothetical protein
MNVNFLFHKTEYSLITFHHNSIDLLKFLTTANRKLQMSTGNREIQQYRRCEQVETKTKRKYTKKIILKLNNVNILWGKKVKLPLCLIKHYMGERIYRATFS